jgi:DNA-binding CsgD family transcriptional regulator
LTVHASTLRGGAGAQTVVVIGPAPPEELNSLLLDAHGLTPAQQRVTEQLLRGYSTRQIVAELHISAYTVQEHLRAAFDKFGVGSRRELIAALTRSR